MNKKNTFNFAFAAAFVVATAVAVSLVGFSTAQASGSHATSVDYSYSSGSSDNNGGAHDTGCCTQTTSDSSGSHATSIDYTYPASTPAPTPTYYATSYTNGGGCSSNCGTTVINYPAPTCTISATPASITSGQAVTVTWSSSNAVQGSISNIGTNVAMYGSYTLYPTQSTTFTGTFKNASGQTVTCVTNVGVLPPPPQYCPAGYTGTYPNCVPIQYCPSGYTGTYPNCYPPQQNNPSCTITINNYNNNNGYNSNGNNYYNPNQAVTISWNSSYAQNGFINNGMGSVALSGTRTVYPTQTTTYTGTFYGYNGQSVTCSATVYINNYVPPAPSAPYVTLAAVPYTGLDLGPVGTVVYWGFLAFWCLLAAYLIAIKRVQNQVYASLRGILFGSSNSNATAQVAHVAPVAYNSHVTHSTPIVRNEDLVDDFVMAQINRNRA